MPVVFPCDAILAVTENEIALMHGKECDIVDHIKSLIPIAENQNDSRRSVTIILPGK